MPAAAPEGAEPPAIRTSNALQAGGGPGQAVETIESILIRSHRRELIDRVGPHVERYLPTEDPTAFLLPDSRLEPWERRWQKVFVALPWLIFACMLAVPLALVRGNLPWLQRRAEEERRAAEVRAAALALGRVPDFAVVSFSQMPDVLERPFPTLLLLFDRATFASAVLLPAFRDLEAVFRAAGLKVAVAALDLSALPGPPNSFLWEYPRALAPHLQLVVPRARDGEAGVIDYEGPWTAAALAEAVHGLAGPYPPDVPPEELARLDDGLERLREALFELLFVEDGAGPAPRPAGRPWWRRLGRGSTAGADSEGLEARRHSAAEAAAQLLDLSGGLDRALASCQEAREALAAELRRPA